MAKKATIKKKAAKKPAVGAKKASKPKQQRNKVQGTMEEIGDEAVATLAKAGNKDGATRAKMMAELKKKFDNPEATISMVLWQLPKDRADKVLHPEKNKYIHTNWIEAKTPKKERPRDETLVYNPFAEYLMDTDVGLGECTSASRVGGSPIKVKWTNPDVVGVRLFQTADGIRVQELISGEIKDSLKLPDLVTGFGQACAYKLFSHRSYLVIPAEIDSEDFHRLDTLCGKFKVGLVLFNTSDSEKFSWEIRHRAELDEPDPVYYNEMQQNFRPLLGY